MTEKEFIAKWVSFLSNEGIKNFSYNLPQEFSTIEISLPGKALVIGSQLFGAYEILTVDGSPIFHSEDYITAKYILYSNRNRPLSLRIPINKEKIKCAVDGFEDYIDSLIKKIDADYKRHFSDQKDSSSVTNAIFRALNITRY